MPLQPDKPQKVIVVVGMRPWLARLGDNHVFVLYLGLRLGMPLRWFLKLR